MQAKKTTTTVARGRSNVQNKNTMVSGRTNAQNKNLQSANAAVFKYISKSNQAKEPPKVDTRTAEEIDASY